ncbi:MAG: DUF1801 domain-containing protein [Bacteroidota bacterium]|nr:DUF1801 domain-containing protein [Bacteroidota bacterium]
MAELKTKETDEGVEKFLNTIEDETKREDCFAIAEIMKQVTRQEPKMWGAAIVGFGSYHYKYESGREGDMCMTGFSPRKQAITLYLSGAIKSEKDLLQKLGKHKTGEGCLYIKKLSDVDTKVLKQLIKTSVDLLKKRSK